MEFTGSFYEKLIENPHNGVFFVDRERRITYWNAAAEELTGFKGVEAVGRLCFDSVLESVDEGGCVLCRDRCPVAACMADGKPQGYKVYIRHKLGHRIPVGVRYAPIWDGDKGIVGAVVVCRDISALKQHERKASEMERLAYQDSLTGLPNRRYARLKVEHAVQEVNEFGRRIGLLMIGVDKFKQVNDVHGDHSGDLVLKLVGNTLFHSLRQDDVVGRWSDDKFLVIARDVDENTLAGVAEKCCKLVAESSVPLGDERIGVTVSVGDTLLQGGDLPDSAIERADELMHRSKNSGRNQISL